MSADIVPWRHGPGATRNGDGGVASGGEPPHDSGMEARVAVLEEIARSTKEALVGIRADMAETRKEMRDGFRDVRADYRWLMGITIGLAAFTVAGFTGILTVVAHGFKWL